MNTTFSIRLDKSAKDKFLSTTKARNLDGAIIIRQFIEIYNNNPDILKIDLDEELFDKELVKLFEDKRVQTKLTQLGDAVGEIDIKSK